MPPLVPTRFLESILADETLIKTHLKHSGGTVRDLHPTSLCQDVLLVGASIARAMPREVAVLATVRGWRLLAPSEVLVN